MAATLVGQMAELNVADHPLPDTNSAAHALRKAMDETRRLLELTSSHGSRKPEDTVALRRELVQLGNASLRASDVIDCKVVNDIISSGNRHPFVKQLLSQDHFKNQVKVLVRRVFDDTTIANENVSARVMEECYREAISSSGALHSNWYFDSPDVVELEEYSDMERFEYQDAWFEFWFDMVAEHSSSVLFWPLAVEADDPGESRNRLSDPPRLLFRVYDLRSAGINNDTIIASQATMVDFPECRDDLLSQDMDEMSKRLLAHSEMDSRDPPSNLVSWTSSLLVALQTATYRAKRSGGPDTVKICAVDTSKFPLGQFAPDDWLLNASINGFADSDPGPNDAEVLNLLKLRRDYPLGEYLSQGALNHRDRSCTFTLQKILDNGVAELLYPEFLDPAHENSLSNRMKELRLKWESETHNNTTRDDIYCASKVAKTCFPRFERDEMVILLLTLKNRSNVDFNTNNPEKYNMRHRFRPLEVGRFHYASWSFASKNKEGSGSEQWTPARYFCCKE